MSTQDKVILQGTALTLGAAAGAITKHAVTAPPQVRQGALAIQVGSAMGAAAATGAGVSGSLSAGAAVVGAKVAAVTAATTAAAPIVLTVAAVGGIAYGAFKLIDWLTD